MYYWSTMLPIAQQLNLGEHRAPVSKPVRGDVVLPSIARADDIRFLNTSKHFHMLVAHCSGVTDTSMHIYGRQMILWRIISAYLDRRLGHSSIFSAAMKLIWQLTFQNCWYGKQSWHQHTQAACQRK
jgi:hypothetical protein